MPIAETSEDQGKPGSLGHLPEENLLSLMVQSIDPAAAVAAAAEYTRRQQEKTLDPAKIRDLTDAFNGDQGAFQRALILLYDIQQGRQTFEGAMKELIEHKNNTFR